MPISIGSHRGAAARAVDTSNVSRVVLSFNNAGGGHLFVHWLRNELMKGLNYFGQNSVYLDNVAARYNLASDGTIYHNGLGGNGVPYWEDQRFKDAMKSEVPLVGPNRSGGPNYATIGGMHTAWEEMWANALRTSKVLIQLQTPEYLAASVKDGSPCARELGRINAALGAGTIEVLALGFGDVPQGGIALNTGARTTPMIVTKVRSGLGRGGHNWGTSASGNMGIAFQDSYKLSETDLHRIIQFCKSKGC